MHQTRNLHIYELTSGWAQIRAAKNVKKGDQLQVLKDRRGGLHIRVLPATDSDSQDDHPRRRAPRPTRAPGLPRAPASLSSRYKRTGDEKEVSENARDGLAHSEGPISQESAGDERKSTETSDKRQGGDRKGGERSDKSRLSMEPIALSTKAAMKIDNHANRHSATVVYLGDSIIMGIPSRLYRNRRSQNFGKNGACAEDLQVLSRSAKFSLECSPSIKAVVVGVGTNNLWKDPVDIVVNQIIEAIDVLCHNYKHANILVLGVLPRGDTGYNDIEALNRKIATFNRQLRHKCRHVQEDLSKRVSFLDIGYKLSVDGQIISPLYMADGLHLSPSGYEVFMGELNKELDRILGPADSPVLEASADAQQKDGQAPGPNNGENITIKSVLNQELETSPAEKDSVDAASRTKVPLPEKNVDSVSYGEMSEENVISSLGRSLVAGEANEID